MADPNRWAEGTVVRYAPCGNQEGRQNGGDKGKIVMITVEMAVNGKKGVLRGQQKWRL